MGTDTVNRYYCALCGGPFRTTHLTYRTEHEWGYDTKVWPGYRREELPAEATMWLNRAVVFTDNVREIYQTATILSKKENRTLASASVQFDNPHPFFSSLESGIYANDGNTRLDVFELADDRPYYVVIHEDCEGILGCVIREGVASLKSKGEFFDLCHSTQRKRRGSGWERLEQMIGEQQRLGGVKYSLPKGIEWPHGYGGAEKYGLDWSYIPGADLFYTEPWWSEEGAEWLCASPAEIDSPEALENYLLHLSERVTPGTEPSIPRKPVPPRLSSLETLPAIALENVASYLPLDSFFKLKRCSSSLNSALQMSSGFWFNKLVSGNAVPWLWEMDEIRQALKKRAYMGRHWYEVIKALLRGSDVENQLLGIRNRRRIWNFAASLRAEDNSSPA